MTDRVCAMEVAMRSYDCNYMPKSGLCLAKFLGGAFSMFLNKLLLIGSAGIGDTSSMVSSHLRDPDYHNDPMILFHRKSVLK